MFFHMGINPDIYSYYKWNIKSDMFGNIEPFKKKCHLKGNPNRTLSLKIKKQKRKIVKQSRKNNRKNK